MPSRDEIVQRANEEYNGTLAEWAAVRAEILRQQRDALWTLPEARAALEAHQAAIREAQRASEAASRQLDVELASADAAAREGLFEADERAHATRERELEAAELQRTQALNSARDEYDAEYAAAARLTGAAADARRNAARVAYDGACSEAEERCRDQIDAAHRAFDRATSDSREAAIAAIEKARDEYHSKQMAIAADLSRATDAAARTLTATLASLPVAAAVQEGFEHRLADVDAEYERVKRDVLTRMRQELAEAGT